MGEKKIIAYRGIYCMAGGGIGRLLPTTGELGKRHETNLVEKSFYLTGGEGLKVALHHGLVKLNCTKTADNKK